MPEVNPQRTYYGIVLESLNPGQCEPLSPGFVQVLNSRSALFLHCVCMCVLVLLGVSSCPPVWKELGLISSLLSLMENWSSGYTNINWCRATPQAEKISLVEFNRTGWSRRSSSLEGASARLQDEAGNILYFIFCREMTHTHTKKIETQGTSDPAAACMLYFISHRALLLIIKNTSHCSLINMNTHAPVYFDSQKHVFRFFFLKL